MALEHPLFEEKGDVEVDRKLDLSHESFSGLMDILNAANLSSEIESTSILITSYATLAREHNALEQVPEESLTAEEINKRGEYRQKRNEACENLIEKLKELRARAESEGVSTEWFDSIGVYKEKTDRGDVEEWAETTAVYLLS